MSLLNYILNEANETWAIVLASLVFATIILIHFGVAYWLGWIGGIVILLWDLISFIVIYFTIPIWRDMFISSNSLLLMPRYLLEPFIFGILLSAASLFGILVISCFQKLIRKRMKMYKESGVSIIQDKILGSSIGIISSFPIAIVAASPFISIISNPTPFTNIYETILKGTSFTKWDSITSSKKDLRDYYNFTTNKTTINSNDIYDVETMAKIFSADVGSLSHDLISIYNSNVTNFFDNTKVFHNPRFVEEFRDNFDKILEFYNIKINKIDVYNATSTEISKFNFNIFDNWKVDFQTKFGQSATQMITNFKIDLEFLNEYSKGITDIIWNQFMDLSTWQKNVPNWHEYVDLAKGNIQNFVSDFYFVRS